MTSITAGMVSAVILLAKPSMVSIVRVTATAIDLKTSSPPWGNPLTTSAVVTAVMKPIMLTLIDI